MNYSSYYDVASNELQYLRFVMGQVEQAPSFNILVVQAQQIVEKYLKHLVQTYVFTEDVNKILKSHKLITLYYALQKQGIDMDFDANDLRYLSEFYFDGRYPGTDYLVATVEDAKKGLLIAEQAKIETDRILAVTLRKTSEIETFE